MDVKQNGETEATALEASGLSQRARIKWLLVLALFIVLAVFSFSGAIVATLFLVALLLHIDRSIPLAVSIGFLLICVLLTALQQQSAAKVLAEWAYYFLAIGVVLIFIDHVKAGPEDDSSTGQ